MNIERAFRETWSLVKESVTAWSDDYAPSMGAALSYYALFSIGPLLIIVIAVAGFFFGDEAASGQIFDQISGLVGQEGASAVQGVVQHASQPARGAIASVIGVVTLLLGATTVFAELQSDLNRIWRVPPTKQKSGLWNMLRSRLLTFGMVLGVGFLLLVSLALSAAIAALGSLWSGLAGGWEVVLHVVNFVVSFAVVTGLFAMIYKVLPNMKISWHDVWIGSAVTALLFAVGKFAIGLYLGKSSVVSSFGGAGSLVVVLLWVYYSTQIFLLGAEFTWAYAYRYGSLKGMKRPDKRASSQADAPDAPTSERGHSDERAPTRYPPPPPVDQPDVGVARRKPQAAALARPAVAIGMAAMIGVVAGQCYDWIRGLHAPGRE